MKPLNGPSFEIGEIVYIDIPGSECIGRISSIEINPNGITYYVLWNDASAGTFYPGQLTRKKPPVVTEDTD